MSDERLLSLVRLAQGGDREAFGELARQFEETVFGTVLRRLRNRSEAMEVTQDVFLQAFRKIGQLREPERFAGWLLRIAVRMSINRAVRRPSESVRAPETFGGLTAERVTPLDDMLRAERARQVWGGLAKLRELDRRTLIAFYVEGRSLKQMSAEFRSPIGTIKRRLHTARNRLRDELAALQPA